MRRRKTAVLLVLAALLAAGFLLWGNCSLQTTETALVSPALTRVRRASHRGAG